MVLLLSIVTIAPILYTELEDRYSSKGQDFERTKYFQYRDLLARPEVQGFYSCHSGFFGWTSWVALKMGWMGLEKLLREVGTADNSSKS